MGLRESARLVMRTIALMSAMRILASLAPHVATTALGEGVFAICNKSDETAIRGFVSVARRDSPGAQSGPTEK